MVFPVFSDGLTFNSFSSSESSDESPLATSPLRHRLPQSMKTVHEIMYKVEVLYVLCVLLMGRQRNQVSLLRPESNVLLLAAAEPRLIPPRRFRRSTGCWPISVSSRGSTTCSTSSSGGNTPRPITWCTARMRTATAAQYEPLHLLLSLRSEDLQRM